MLKKLILLSIFSLSSIAQARAPGTYTDLRTELQKVSKRQLMDWVGQLVKESAPSRMVGMPGHGKAVSWLQETIRKVSKGSGKLEVSSTPPDIASVRSFYQKDFDEKVEGKIPKNSTDYRKWSAFTRYMQMLADENRNQPVQNLIWEKSGISSEKILVVTAHYDTISHDKDSLLVTAKVPMPGANYNASGVAVALGLIQALSQIDLNYTVRVVFLDWQGIGFHGSELYAKELQNSGKQILGVINLEMLGQDTSYFDKTKKNGNMAVYVRNIDKDVRWVKTLTERGARITKAVSFEVRPNGFENSDNFRFSDAGFLSATFSQNWEEDFNPKFYQTAQDTPETLNQETLWHGYQYVGGAVVGSLLDLSK